MRSGKRPGVTSTAFASSSLALECGSSMTTCLSSCRPIVKPRQIMGAQLPRMRRGARAVEKVAAGEWRRGWELGISCRRVLSDRQTLGVEMGGGTFGVRDKVHPVQEWACMRRARRCHRSKWPRGRHRERL